MVAVEVETSRRRRVLAPTANILSEGLDPGEHLDELDGAEDFVHLLHSSVGNDHASPPEVGCHSGAEHLNIQRQSANHYLRTGPNTEVWNQPQFFLRDTDHYSPTFDHDIGLGDMTLQPSVQLRGVQTTVHGPTVARRLILSGPWLSS